MTIAPSLAPASLRSELLRTLVERGYVHQCTDLEALDAAAVSRRITGYIGFDATADSLHVGSLVQIMLLRHMQRTGHRPIVPHGGRHHQGRRPVRPGQERQLLSQPRIDSNIAGIRRVFERFLDFDAGAALMVDNSGLARRPALHPVPARVRAAFLGQPDARIRVGEAPSRPRAAASFLEFNYMVLQAYDFLELGRRHDCRLQMGGSDQWGNIVCGVSSGAGPPVSSSSASPPRSSPSRAGRRWGRRRRGRCGSTRTASHPTSTGSTGGTPRTRTWALPSPLHGAPPRRGRPARIARRGGDQRGEGDPRHRGDRPLPREGGGRGGGGDGASHVRTRCGRGRARGRAADPRDPAGAPRRRGFGL